MRAKPYKSDCGTRSTKRPLRTYADIVQDYIAEYRRRAATEMRWYSSRSDLQTLVKLAVYCRTPDNKRHPHQRRLPEAALQAAHSRLSRIDFEACESFDALHGQIAQAIGAVPKIGELAIYDIACRIGAFLRIEPEQVFLHRGTRIGARHLGLGRGKTIEVSELPKAFHRLKPHEIEDCLCIYKDELKECPR